MTKERRTVSDDLGSMIRRLRESKGYSTQKLGELSNVTASYVNRLERGIRKRPTVVIIEDLASALGVDMEVLLSAGSNNNQRKIISLDQLLYSHDFSIGDSEPVDTEVKDLLLHLIDTIYDSEWKKETMVKEIHEILIAVDQLKEELK